MRRAAILALLVAAAAAGGFAFKPGSRPAPAASMPMANTARVPSATVTTEQVSTRAMRGTVAATGTVTAWREVVVGAEVGGLSVTSLLADEGDRVEAGAVLATLSDGVLRAQVDQQKAALLQAEASLEAARSQDRNATALAPLKAISREEAEQRRAALRTAEGRRDAALASVAEARSRLAQTRVVAPVSGTLSRRSISAGAVAATGTEFFRIIQDDRIEIEASVPESEIARLRPGQTARVQPPSGATVDASVRLVPVTVDARTRLGIARLALPTSTGLRPGMFTRIEIVAEDGRVPVVPLKGLVWREGRAHAFKVDGTGTVRLVAVGTGRQADGFVEVRSGLSEGERIAVAGAGFLADGDLVRTAVADAGDGS